MGRMTSKRTDEEIRADLEQSVRDGDMEYAGKDENGEQLYRLTPKGSAICDQKWGRDANRPPTFPRVARPA